MPGKMRAYGTAKHSLGCVLHSCESTLEFLIFCISLPFFTENFGGEN